MNKPVLSRTSPAGRDRFRAAAREAREALEAWRQEAGVLEVGWKLLAFAAHAVREWR
jgi:hypothetical protein